MTAAALERALLVLSEAAQRTGDGSVQALDSALATVMQYKSPMAIAPLLLMLNDAADYQEGMFSLIHAAEAFDDSTYVRSLLDILPDLCSSAPRWSSIVLMRAMNSDSTNAELVRALRDAVPAVKQSVIWLCTKINERGPKFVSKTLPALVAATGPSASPGGSVLGSGTKS
jgi:Immunity protein 30